MKLIISLNLEQDLIRKIDRVAKREGRSRSNMIERLIIQEIAKNTLQSHTEVK